MDSGTPFGESWENGFSPALQDTADDLTSTISASDIAVNR